MFVRYGAYIFGANENHITAGVQTHQNKGGQPYSQTRWVEVKGDLLAVGQGLLILAENALRTALATHYQDLVFMADDTVTVAESLLNAGSITGVRIVDGPHFKDTMGPQFATIRSYSFKAEAEYPLAVRPAYLSFEESLSFAGGGPTYAHRRALNTTPQKQQVWPATEYVVTQSGSASGYLDYPPIPGPKFPQAQKQNVNFRRMAPERKGPVAWQGFGISWEYVFESATPLVGFPTLWAF